MSFITIVCINYKSVTYINQGHKFASLVVQTNLNPHILPRTRNLTCIPSCVIIEKDMIFELTIE